jgi:hypothetical protein
MSQTSCLDCYMSWRMCACFVVEAMVLEGGEGQDGQFERADMMGHSFWKTLVCVSISIHYFLRRNVSSDIDFPTLYVIPVYIRTDDQPNANRNCYYLMKLAWSTVYTSNYVRRFGWALHVICTLPSVRHQCMVRDCYTTVFIISLQVQY